MLPHELALGTLRGGIVWLHALAWDIQIIGSRSVLTIIEKALSALIIAALAQPKIDLELEQLLIEAEKRLH